MRRGNFIKGHGQAKAAVGVNLAPEHVQKRNTVDEVLQMYKKGHRDVKQTLKMIKESENDDKKGMQLSIEQISDILITVGYFEKAMALLEEGQKNLPGDPIMHELIARCAFIMEDFEKSISHNQKAAALQPN